MAAAALLRTSRTEIEVIRGLGEDAKAEALAAAGVDWALFHMLSTSTNGEAGPRALERGLSLAGGSVRITIEDEAGKIDLNRSSAALLSALFQSVGQAPQEAERLVAAIEDFRDPDHERREGGAEDEDYAAAGRVNGAKDGPFAATAELMQVLGMDRQRYQRVAPFLTVYSPRRQVDIDRAPRGVLKALGLLPSADLKHLIESRNAQTDDLATSYSSVFAVRAEATTQNGAHFVRVAIVRRTANPATPFEILEWRRDWSGGQDSR